jgi:hypothetical protein
MAGPRRSVEEWITAFELSADIKHIFLEGPRDVNLLTPRARRFAALDLRSTMEIKITTQLAPTPYLSGSRGKLFEFAERIEQAGIRNVRVLIDADMGAFDPTAGFPANCIRTDYANLPISYLNQERFAEALLRSIGYELNANDWVFLQSALAFLFAFRRYRYLNYPALSGPAPGIIVRCENKVAVLDREHFLQRFVLMGCAASPAEMAAVVGGYEQELQNLDFRSYCHFHDFLAVLYVFLRCLQRLPAGFRQEHLEAILLASLQVSGGLPKIDQLFKWARRR